MCMCNTAHPSCHPHALFRGKFYYIRVLRLLSLFIINQLHSLYSHIYSHQPNIQATHPDLVSDKVCVLACME